MTFSNSSLHSVILCLLYPLPLSLQPRDSKKSLLEEGNIMASLNHERVVKLLGVIMEDKDCSLVMELIPRGNLLVMLQTVSTLPTVCARRLQQTLSQAKQTLLIFLGLCATYSQGQDHFGDPGSNGVPVRAPHHTQRPEAREHFGGQGLSHQGAPSQMHLSQVLLFQHSRGSFSFSFICDRLQTLDWPPARCGAN